MECTASVGKIFQDSIKPETGNIKNLLTEIYRLANLSEKVEQEVTIQAC